MPSVDHVAVAGALPTAKSAAVSGFGVPQKRAAHVSQAGSPQNKVPLRSETQLGESLHSLAQVFGLQGGIYVHFGHAVYGDVVPARFLASSVSDRRFFLDEAALTSDPVARRAVAAHMPFAWSVAAVAEADATQRWFAARMKGRGIHCGIAIPVQDYASGPAFVSLYTAFSGEVEALIATRGPELAYAAASFHENAKAMLPTAGEGSQLALTAREMQCLRLAALGQTVNDSAEALSVTPRTIEFHLKNAADKLGAPNKLRAVVLAVGRGLIAP